MTGLRVQDRDVGGRCSLQQLLEDDALRSVYQPIVELASGEVVAYEALIRGPEGHPLEMPGALFAAAAAEGLLDELEWAGVRCAIEGALAAGLPATTGLFINVEGSSVGRDRTPAQLEVLRRASGLRVVVEVTERDLLAHPAALLRATNDLRGRGWGMAIDDVGLQHPEGIAALEMVRPDVVKLDMGLVQHTATPAEAGIGLAVQAFVERHGGSVIAEGIEGEVHRERAIAMGATHGQGWHFGRPGPLPTALAPTRAAMALHDAPRGEVGGTPYAIARDRLTFRTASKRILLPISHQLEAQALAAGPAVLLFGVFQERQHFTVRSAQKYAQLSHQLSMVAAFAAGMEQRPMGRIRGADLEADDPLRDEWTVIVLGPHYAAALVAQDLGGDDGADMDRPFRFAVTHDRALVADMASSLMIRIADRAGLGHLAATA